MKSSVSLAMVAMLRSIMTVLYQMGEPKAEINCLTFDGYRPKAHNKCHELNTLKSSTILSSMSICCFIAEEAV